MALFSSRLRKDVTRAWVSFDQIQLYTGNIPELDLTTDEEISPGTLLMTVPFSMQYTDSASGLTPTFEFPVDAGGDSPMPPFGLAVATGVVGYARISWVLEESYGYPALALPRVYFKVGSAPGPGIDMVMSETSIVAGQRAVFVPSMITAG